MNNKIYFVLAILSTTVICFEILSTRVSSVIFVSNYAFIIISLAILGIGCGGLYSYFKIKINEKFQEKITKYLFLVALSFLFFILIVVEFSITDFYLYFILLFFPFFFAGIIYSQIFKKFSGIGFRLYAADLAGAALGSVCSIAIFILFNTPNAILFLSVLVFFTAFLISPFAKNKNRQAVIISAFILTVVVFAIFGKSEILGKITIGKFDEKDYYYVYPNADKISRIVESQWSIFGRADLVEYSNQDVVKQLFIDGAAGSQMYRFDGDIKKPDDFLYSMLMQHSGSIPLLFLNDYEKNNMLVIGPGGGKEVLVGLLDGVGQITGVEVNPGFVNLVKKYSDFNGGIYTDFHNVHIEVEEGRHFIKKTDQHYNIIVMSLPSTEQLQSIDNFAMNENYLLTVEALNDYLNILTENGRLIFTVHNRWELMRLIITAFEAFNKVGISGHLALNHFMLLEDDYAPTIVIKKNAFTQNEIIRTKAVIKQLPKGLPKVTYIPYHMSEAANTPINQVLKLVNSNPGVLKNYVNENKYNIEPCRDDSPYFYKVNRGVPDDYLWLFISVFIINILLFAFPLYRIKAKSKLSDKRKIKHLLFIFASLGIGFMMVEVSLFQKLILYLGSATVSLSILLSSLLIGMGAGSFYGKGFFKNDLLKRVQLMSLIIALTGIVVFLAYPIILNECLVLSLYIRALITFVLVLPLGFLLGIPFPSCIVFMKENKLESYIPWVYGINGTMSVLGSILAGLMSMISGFSVAFFLGLVFYLLVAVLSMKLKRV